MKLTEFKYLVELYTQDTQAKMPVKFEDWQFLLQRSIINLANTIEIDELIVKDETEDKALRYLICNKKEKIYIKIPRKIEHEKSEVNINDQLVFAVIFSIAEVLTRDINMKQKLILEKQEIINNYIWNKFTKRELSEEIKIHRSMR